MEKIDRKNMILRSDSYKFGGHFKMYQDKTNGIFYYYENRVGGQYKKSMLFGLQERLMKLSEFRVTQEFIDVAAKIAEAHFGKPEEECFNRPGWEKILNENDGKIPLVVKALPEGTIVNEGNALFTVEYLPGFSWVPGYFETFLMRTWYPSAVATRSMHVTQMCKAFLEKSSDEPGDYYKYMLHDFGGRAVSSDEAAEMGGLAHAINSYGSDTVETFMAGVNYYKADINDLIRSVPATEHSISESYGEGAGEEEYLSSILSRYPEGIVSIVIDTYNAEDFITKVVPKFKHKILSRNGRVVFRPDSPRFKGDTPEDQVLWITRQLAQTFGFDVNTKGYEVLNPKVGVIYGDGLVEKNVYDILCLVTENGFSVENLVFGMGGNLSQKLNRDTQRVAYKASAIMRDKDWVGIWKKPLDATKASKKGVLDLVERDGQTMTVDTIEDFNSSDKTLLRLVYDNAELHNLLTFNDVKENVARSVKEINFQA